MTQFDRLNRDVLNTLKPYLGKVDVVIPGLSPGIAESATQSLGPKPSD